MHPLDFAMQLEQEGKIFYLTQASHMEDRQFKQVFESLAKDEEKHYQLLKQIKNSGAYDFVESTLLDDVPSIFAEPFRKEPEEKLASHVGIYRQALEFEEKAIDLYSSLAREAKSDLERETFLKLVKEEEAHHTIIWRILQLLQRPEEWYPYLD